MGSKAEREKERHKLKQKRKREKDSQILAECEEFQQKIKILLEENHNLQIILGKKEQQAAGSATESC